MRVANRLGAMCGIASFAIGVVACSVNSVPPATSGDAGKDSGGPVVDSSVEGGSDAGGDASNVCVFGSSTFGNCVFGP